MPLSSETFCWSLPAGTPIMFIPDLRLLVLCEEETLGSQPTSIFAVSLFFIIRAGRWIQLPPRFPPDVCPSLANLVTLCLLGGYKLVIIRAVARRRVSLPKFFLPPCYVGTPRCAAFFSRGRMNALRLRLYIRIPF